MDFNEDYDDFEGLPRIKNMPIARSSHSWKPKPKERSSSKNDQILEQMDEIREYNFTYEASRHERAWILDSLGIFHDLQWFTDIIRLVKGGKEASLDFGFAGDRKSVV